MSADMPRGLPFDVCLLTTAQCCLLQIWVPSITDEAELCSILEARIASDAAAAGLAGRLLAFWREFCDAAPLAARAGLSVRDLLAWVGFVNATSSELGPLSAYVHGAYLTLLDGLGLGLGVPPAALAPLRARCRALLCQQLTSMPQSGGTALLPHEAAAAVAQAAAELTPGAASADIQTDSGQRWGIPPFFIERAAAPDMPWTAQQGGAGSAFNWAAPTTCRNAFRLLRAMQVGFRA
jgi:midasin